MENGYWQGGEATGRRSGGTGGAWILITHAYLELRPLDVHIQHPGAPLEEPRLGDRWLRLRLRLRTPLSFPFNGTADCHLPRARNHPAWVTVIGVTSLRCDVHFFKATQNHHCYSVCASDGDQSTQDFGVYDLV